MPTETIERPIIRDVDRGTTNDEWGVMIFNDDITPYDAVVAILMVATGCSLEEAEMETWEAHHHGRALVHYGTNAECNRVASTIESIGVKTKVVEI